MAVTKVRIRFSKHGDPRLLSHHDLMRGFERALRRAALPVALSQGFSPRPRMSIAQALALGIEGRREVLELEMAEPLEAEEVRNRLAAVLPPGLDLLEAELVPTGQSAQAVSLWYHIEVPEARREAAALELESLIQSSHRVHVRIREEKRTTLDLRSFLMQASLDDNGILRFQLRVTPAGSARPEEILETLQLRDLLTSGGILVRDDVELAAIPPSRVDSSTLTVTTRSNPESVLVQDQSPSDPEAEIACPSSL